MVNTMIQVETSDGIREVTLNSKLLVERKIFITDEINMEMANEFAKTIMYLDDGDQDIDIYINSTGGEVMAGLVMYDVIQAAKSPINIYCVGQAYSMAAILLACGTKGRRFMLPHSKAMIHEPLIAGGVGGSATSIRNVSESILETKRMLVELLEKHTDRNMEEVEKAISYDNYMTPEEAIQFGLCDKVVERLY